MECKKCKTAISDGEEREHNGALLCEDCYIDVLSPAKFCDPWADYAAKSSLKNNPEVLLNANQSQILKVLEGVDEIESEALLDKLEGLLSPEDAKRECAALKRLNKIAIESKNGKAMIRRME
jgi:hypothetical protein